MTIVFLIYPSCSSGKPTETLRRPEYINQPDQGIRRPTSVAKGKGSMPETKTSLGREMLTTDSKVQAPVVGLLKDASVRKPLSATVNR